MTSGVSFGICSVTDSESLEVQATQFAEDLTRTVHAVVSNCKPFKATALEGANKFSVKQDPDEGIPLRVDGEPRLLLKVEFYCRLDGPGRFLAVVESNIKVFADVSKNEPLFRYEYERSAESIPAAHIQVHGHRDSLTYVMTRSGSATKRGRDRAVKNKVPKMQDLHFPLGGHRFRPCLEDVLEMLIDEFGIDHDKAHSLAALRSGREKWRRTQTKSAVRDDPASAVEVLMSLGYQIELPPGAADPPTNNKRLRLI